MSKSMHLKLIVFVILGIFSICDLPAIEMPKALKNARYITSDKGKDGVDGFGAHLLERMSAIAFAAHYKKTYVHQPFCKLAHNYENNPDFHNEMELFANIGKGFPTMEGLDSKNVFSAKGYSLYVNKKIDSFYNKDVLALFKINYYSTPKNEIPYFDKGRVNVAVHIRRGDVLDMNLQGMLNSDEHYLAAMKKIRKLYPSAKFFIYSEGKEEQFARFKLNDVELHLNEDIKDTFHALVTADILVTSKSTFSYTAALLSDGVIFYTPYGNPKLSHWIEL